MTEERRTDPWAGTPSQLGVSLALDAETHQGRVVLRGLAATETMAHALTPAEARYIATLLRRGAAAVEANNARAGRLREEGLPHGEITRVLTATYQPAVGPTRSENAETPASSPEQTP